MIYSPNYNKKFSYEPKRPVKSFMDLEVYQKALEANVFAVNTLYPAFCKTAAKNAKNKTWSKEVFEVKEIIIKTLVNRACLIPHLIAEAHSLRFGDHSSSVVALEKVMLSCNKMMVYLEQTRDICQTDLSWEDFDEAIKRYIYLRRKVLNLQRSWKKFDSQK